MINHIESIPAKIKNFKKVKKEIDELYSSLVGVNIKSTVNHSSLKFNKDYSWTFIYKYNPEEGFKVNHEGEHFYMSEEDMWEILENVVEVVK